MSKNFLITDADGVKAVVDSVAERDRWIRVHGASEAAAVVPGDRVWLRHTIHGGYAALPAEAAEQWAALGWQPSAPPEPVDTTKDPALTDPAPAAEPEKTPTRTAAGGDQKEK